MHLANANSLSVGDYYYTFNIINRGDGGVVLLLFNFSNNLPFFFAKDKATSAEA